MKKKNKRTIAALLFSLSSLAVSTSSPQAGPLPAVTAPIESQQATKTAGSTDPMVTASVRAPDRNTTTAPAVPHVSVFESTAIPIGKLDVLKQFAPAWKAMTNGGGKATSLQVSYTAKNSLHDRLTAVNVSVNRTIRYQSDSVNYGSTDYWATPQETLARGKGDCEDFAILKMYLLAKEGIAYSDMALVIVLDQKRGLYHAVLDVRVDGLHYILDNQRMTVVRDHQLPQYMAMYSIWDGRGYLHGRPRSDTQSVASSNGSRSLLAQKAASPTG